MGIIMAGIDFHCAGITIRKKVGFAPREIKKLLARICEELIMRKCDVFITLRNQTARKDSSKEIADDGTD